MLRTRSLCQDLTPSARISFAWQGDAKVKDQEDTEEIGIVYEMRDRCCCFRETFLVVLRSSFKRKKHLKLPLLKKNYF